MALAASLGADCEIYSDVDGVYTADPRVVTSPRRLDEISYEEMQELARAGAKVLNAEAVEFAREKGIAIHARATSGSTAETVVRGHAAPGGRIAGVTSQKSVALVDVPWGGLGAALEALERRGARRRGGDRARGPGGRGRPARQRPRVAGGAGRAPRGGPGGRRSTTGTPAR